ncbi:hypothetical protein Ciccas_012340 [Cichlidogyrus casuarinus]|uniref:Uncharacterized protein n=1 Tax=Cichlidogyrus casuarinus TaxID=1844966 RepID=A0ABD2PPD4_9PLAT
MDQVEYRITQLEEECKSIPWNNFPSEIESIDVYLNALANNSQRLYDELSQSGLGGEYIYTRLQLLNGNLRRHMTFATELKTFISEVQSSLEVIHQLERNLISFEWLSTTSLEKIQTDFDHIMERVLDYDQSFISLNSSGANLLSKLSDHASKHIKVSCLTLKPIHRLSGSPAIGREKMVSRLEIRALLPFTDAMLEGLVRGSPFDPTGVFKLASAYSIS